jgi:hypothetical protein
MSITNTSAPLKGVSRTLHLQCWLRLPLHWALSYGSYSGFEPEALDRKQVETQINAILQSLSDGDLDRMLSALGVLYPVQ